MGSWRTGHSDGFRGRDGGTSNNPILLKLLEQTRVVLGLCRSMTQTARPESNLTSLVNTRLDSHHIEGKSDRSYLSSARNEATKLI